MSSSEMVVINCAVKPYQVLDQVHGRTLVAAVLFNYDGALLPHRRLYDEVLSALVAHADQKEGRLLSHKMEEVRNLVRPRMFVTSVSMTYTEAIQRAFRIHNLGKELSPEGGTIFFKVPEITRS